MREAISAWISFDPQVEDNTYQVINHAEIQYTFVDVNDPAAGGSDDAAAEVITSL